ncbi:hypothetical protein Q9251_21450 [Alkalihalobacillus macyae]|nr:hypothetical protein [Alkalihalobacillus macyae]MDP4553424.1 hypothetical protein [Alkalihalobacillus macyae]
MHKKVQLLTSSLFLVTILAGCNANNTSYNQNEPEVNNRNHGDGSADSHP